VDCVGYKGTVELGCVIGQSGVGLLGLGEVFEGLEGSGGEVTEINRPFLWYSTDS
jgi:hypothetical protein